MSISKNQIDEAELGARANELKTREQYPVLKDYLIGTIASGRLTARLQAKAYKELGLVHLHLDEPEEAEKAFRSASERDAGAVGPLSAATDIPTCGIDGVASSNSGIPK